VCECQAIRSTLRLHTRHAALGLQRNSILVKMCALSIAGMAVYTDAPTLRAMARPTPYLLCLVHTLVWQCTQTLRPSGRWRDLRHKDVRGSGCIYPLIHHFGNNRSGQLHVPAALPLGEDASGDWAYHNAQSCYPYRYSNSDHSLYRSRLLLYNTSSTMTSASSAFGNIPHKVISACQRFD
jgi:hypothetical protein